MKILSVRGFKALLLNRIKLLRALTPSRIINYLKLQTGYFFSGFSANPKQWAMPVAVSVEPTTACNLRCPECPTGTRTLHRAPGSIGFDDFKTIINKLPRQTTWLTLYFQGEPYLNKNFYEMIRFAKQRRMFVATSTNGHFLDADNAQKTIDSGLDTIIISLDGADAETYEKYRQGGSFDKVVSGIRTLADLKRKSGTFSPLVVLQCLVFKHNEHQVQKMEKLGKQLGADVLEFKTAQHYDFENGNPYMTSIAKYSRYRKNKEGSFEIKRKLKNRCRRMWDSCVITWDGSVAPCCYDKDASHSYGNLLNMDFREIWNGSKADNFRRRLRDGRSGIGICKNCHE